MTQREREKRREEEKRCERESFRRDVFWGSKKVVKEEKREKEKRRENFTT